jgi:LAO/AO transport system kinase
VSAAELEKRVERALAGDIRAAARLMRQIEDDPIGARSALAAIYPRTGDARVIGVTGNPGSGKSTLVSKMVARYRQAGLRVGVIAVDPSSPFSGGAILGDRIRMMEHAADPGVFIRSCSTRGALGGISYATEGIARVMDAIGYDVIIVETVGVGQAEVEIARLAETVVVVLTPGYGDDIQALKAGVLEIADVFVVNKSDHPGADGIVRQLNALWSMRPSQEDEAWQPPIVSTIAIEGAGVEELCEKVAEHSEVVRRDGNDNARIRLKLTLLRLVREELEREISGEVLAPERLEALLDAISTGQTDPYSAARSVVATLLPNRRRSKG